MKFLVLGGTRFLGRAIVDAALARGYLPTLFNRGHTNPDLYPGLERLRGDRTADLSALDGRHFDVVIDVAGYRPADVSPVLATLSDAARYAFVSTVSVYADHSHAQHEDDPLLESANPDDPGEVYGAGKVAAERLVAAAFPGRCLIVRPGLIAGPHDPTDRFAYWPRRVARGGRILAPGGPGHPAQHIDVRDLAGWIVDACVRGLTGVFNVTGTPSTLGHLLAVCQQVITAVPGELVWVPDSDLLAAGVDPWMGVPLWIGAPGWEGANQVDVSRALGAGLAFRPLADTVRDTLAWDLARGGPPPGREGLTAERELDLLARLAPGGSQG